MRIMKLVLMVAILAVVPAFAQGPPPSFALCLNASKAASHLGDATILLHSVCHGAEIRPLKVGWQC
jgi:hypothetical protein